MGNRKQPLGYRIELGVVVLHPEEAPLVTYIYEQYTLGASFNALVNDLRKQAVRYDGDKQWNKNMVARILEDERYIGKKGFPPLIQLAIFQRAQELRSAKQNLSQRTEAEKLLRQLSGRPATAAIPKPPERRDSRRCGPPCAAQGRESDDGSCHGEQIPSCYGADAHR